MPSAIAEEPLPTRSPQETQAVKEASSLSAYTSPLWGRKGPREAAAQTVLEGKEEDWCF